MEYILKGGLVYDGTLNPPKQLDIHIKDGKIYEVAPTINQENVKTISCEGLSISPGWIDAHSHNDFYLTNDHEYRTLPFLFQGITTQIVGNCGFSSYGVEENSPYVEDIGAGLFFERHVDTLKNFSKKLKGKLLQNIVPLVGHGSLRIGIKGKDPAPLTLKERDELINLTIKAMEEGAFGGSLGLMYVPGMFSDFDELASFAKIIAEYDGILTVHPRANSKIALGYPLITKKPHLELGLDEVIKIMEATNVRVEYSHLIFVGKSSWSCYKAMLSTFKKARSKGFDIAYDMYPFTYGASVITVVLPSWYMSLSEKEKQEPFNRFKLKLTINITKKLLGIDFSDMIVNYISPDYPEYEGKTITEIAKTEGLSPFDTYLLLVEKSEGQGRIMLGKYYNEEIIKNLMQDPLTIYMTDAWVEDTGSQNASAYQAFPYFIKRAKEYNFPLFNVINKMTHLTAERFRIPNRGLIKKGYYADITIFNEDEIDVDLNKVDAKPKGIKKVIVNGEIVIEDGQYLDKMNGEFILKEAKKGGTSFYL